MPVSIRPFTADDYSTIVAINNAVFPDYSDSEEEIRFWDENRAAKCRCQRWLAQSDGEAVGFAYYGQSSDTYHPRKFFLNALVLPEYRRQGIGGTLYDRVVAELAPFEPLELRCEVYVQDGSAGVVFLEGRGYVETLREWESRLDPAQFDPEVFAETELSVAEQGIEIKSMVDLAGDAERDRKLYELTCEINQDVPHSTEVTRPPFEEFVKALHEEPGRIPEAYLVAVEGDRYAGLTWLEWSPGDDKTYTGLTGVARAYRRRGIALALKVRILRWAKARGLPSVVTWNSTTNAGMLAINDRLGFVRGPAWVVFAKQLADER